MIYRTPSLTVSQGALNLPLPQETPLGGLLRPPGSPNLIVPQGPPYRFASSAPSVTAVFQGVVTAATSLITTLAQKNPEEFRTSVSLAVSRLSRVSPMGCGHCWWGSRCQRGAPAALALGSDL